MTSNYKKVEDLASDAFNMIVLLKEYCSQNNDTQELQCIHAGIKLLSKVVDELLFEIENSAE